MSAAVRNFLLVAGLFIALFFLVPLALSDRWEARREIRIPAPPGAVAALVADLRRWPEWAPWGNARDPRLDWDVEGSGREAGDVLHWRSDLLGQGTITLEACDAGTGHVSYALALAGGGRRARGELVWSADGPETVLRWRDGGPIQGPAVYRYFASTLASAVEEEQEAALGRLAALASAAD